MPPVGWLGRRPASGVDRVHLMLKGHISCQQGSQTAHPFHNKRRGSVAQRLYVRPIPYAYVMHSRPRDCTRPPLDQGIGTLRGRVRTKLGLDTCHPWTPSRAGSGYSLPRIPGPGGDQSGPHSEGSRTHLGGPLVRRGVQCLPRSRSRPTACIWSTSLPFATWRPQGD
jgi:hypothetical protein